MNPKTQIFDYQIQLLLDFSKVVSEQIAILKEKTQLRLEKSLQASVLQYISSITVSDSYSDICDKTLGTICDSLNTMRTYLIMGSKCQCLDDSLSDDMDYSDETMSMLHSTSTEVAYLESDNPLFPLHWKELNITSTFFSRINDDSWLAILCPCTTVEKSFVQQMGHIFQTMTLKIEHDLDEQRSHIIEQMFYELVPHHICTRLIDTKQNEIADSYEASVIFVDIANFTQYCTAHSSLEVVSMLNSLFYQFDMLADMYQVQRIKTVGDGYLAASGLFSHHQDHADMACQFGIAVQQYMIQHSLLQVRVGIATGPIIGGVMGKSKQMTFDIWGPSVNLACRLQSNGNTSMVHVCATTIQCLMHKEHYAIQSEGKKSIKGMGNMQTYLLQKKS